MRTGCAYLRVEKLPRDTRAERFLLALRVRRDLRFGKLDQLGGSDVCQALLACPLQLVSLPHLHCASGGRERKASKDPIRLRVRGFHGDLTRVNVNTVAAIRLNAVRV